MIEQALSFAKWTKKQGQTMFNPISIFYKSQTLCHNKPASGYLKLTMTIFARGIIPTAES
jgi:hypothetical protein